MSNKFDYNSSERKDSKNEFLDVQLRKNEDYDLPHKQS